MNTANQATQYRAELAIARHELYAVQKFDRTIVRASRIAMHLDRVATLEMLVSLCEADDAQMVEDMAEAV